jgi:hypothetical protein
MSKQILRREKAEYYLYVMQKFGAEAKEVIPVTKLWVDITCIIMIVMCGPSREMFSKQQQSLRSISACNKMLSAAFGM